ncbi:MAG: tetraacyldisaccharide 4'-kinase, partial [Candidatus Angelobacter sp.]
EPFSALRRADAVVTNSSATLPAWLGVVWRIRRDLRLDPPHNVCALAFCGVARPQTFFDELKAFDAHGTRISQTVAFPDHHRYTLADIRRLLQAKAENGADCFITTEKDEINLGALALQLQPLRVARLRLVLENPEIALEMLLQTVEKRNGCTF